MVAQELYDEYQARNSLAIAELLSGIGTRPVLFLGSGIPRRYLGAPNWMGLLSDVAKEAGIDESFFNFLSQKADNKPARLGGLLVDPIHEWAWSQGTNVFPKTYFEASVDKSLFLKHLAAERLKSFGNHINDSSLVPEVDLLKKISPHAIITTNFDSLIEGLFPDFELVVGERVIPMSMNILGEIYKIHGTVDDPGSLVLTQADYERFSKKRRYISSKMMTYFAEYPVFVFGYGLGDENVNSIISDLVEAMKDKGGFIDNIYYVEWVPDIAAIPYLKEEHAVPAEPGLPSIRVRTIVTSRFDWIFKALGDFASPVQVNTKVLRHLAARVIELVRVDVPKNNVEIDYSKIEKLSEEPNELAMVLGISKVTNPNVEYPYILTQVGHKLGFTGWYGADKLLKKSCDELGFNIKESDNEYHLAFKSGTRSFTHKYSEKLVDLLKGIKDRDPSAAEE